MDRLLIACCLGLGIFITAPAAPAHAATCLVGEYLCTALGKCIPNANCCSADQCVIANGDGKCDKPGDAPCSYSCKTGFDLCSNNTCAPTGTCPVDCPETMRQCHETCIDQSAQCCDAVECPGVVNGAPICDKYKCGFACNAGYKACGNKCIPNANCCTAANCTPPANGSGVCNSGACDFTCNLGYKRCGNKCIANSACCADGDCSGNPQNSAATCSQATNTCSWQCVSGYKQCGANTCIPNFQCCTSGDCADAPANASPICASGTCDWTCNAGYKRCGNACIPSTGCCTAGECPAGPNNSAPTCNSNLCSFACNAGYKPCNGMCIPQANCCGDNDCKNPAGALTQSGQDPACFKTQGTCSAGACVYDTNNGNFCNGTNLCTDHCDAGFCVHAQVVCTQIACNSMTCNPATGNCVYSPVNGEACGGDGCFGEGTCDSGTCSGTAIKDCRVDDECKIGLCDINGNCATNSADNGTMCTKACTDQAACTGGVCSGVPRKCTPSTPCFEAACDATVDACVETQKPAGTACDAGGGQCQRGGQCDANGQCVTTPAPDGTACQTDSSCTVRIGTCGAGVCTCVAPTDDKKTDADNIVPATGCAMTGAEALSEGLFIVLALFAVTTLFGQRRPVRVRVRARTRRRL